VFARHAVGARYESLPLQAIEAAKKSLLDTLGVTLAASGVEPAVRAVIDLLCEQGGRPDCTVFGFGVRAPVMLAAFANGALAHCLDFDDQTPWGQHCSSTIVAAALAVAEYRGGVSGRELLTAVAVGQDLFARLRCNVGWKKDWNLSTVLGVFAGTASAGRIMGLTPEQMAHALGIASMRSCGVMEIVAGTGSDLRGMYAAFSASGAVVAALLASRGIGGAANLFEGTYGVFNTYFDGRYDRGRMLEGLGTEYLGGATLYKPWPCVGTAHSHIHATISLICEHDLAPEDVRELRLYAGDYHLLMSTPIEARRAPATLVDAKFSLPYLVAVAAVRRGMRVSDFTEAAIRDPQVLALAQRVLAVEDHSLDWKLELPPGRVQILTRDGRVLERVGKDIPGSASAPLTWTELIRKFDDCAACAYLPPSAAQRQRAVEIARTLETLEDGTKLVRALATGSQ